MGHHKRPKFWFPTQRLPFPIIIAAALYICTSTIAADATIGIPKVVPYAPGLVVSDGVRNECQVGEKLSAYVQSAAKNAKPSDTPNVGRYVDMTITEVLAFRGGWSGPKSITVAGSLLKNGAKVATFRAQRFSTGGIWGPMKGTCAIVARCTKAIAKDIADWLKNPVDGAQLGDAK
jgi:hypothetical protein